MTDESTEVKTETKVTLPVEAPKTEKRNTEEWWTRTSPKHRVAIYLRDEDGKIVQNEKKQSVTTYAKFERSRIELDLEDKHDQNISKGLHECGREGIDIFVIGNNYNRTEMGEKDQIAFAKLLRELASDETGLGLDKVIGLFSMKELREMGINTIRPKNDVDTLIHYALKNKRLSQLK